MRAECTNSAPRGDAVAAALAGAWRQSPPKLEMAAAELNAVIPLLLDSGAGALGWWRLRHSSEPRPIVSSQCLQETYLKYAVHAAVHEQRVAETFSVLRSAGVEPILIKGWAIGRHYPESGLRPSGDIDLCVSPRQRVTAQSVLNGSQCARYWVDLDHDQMERFEERFDELYSRSELVNLENTQVRVAGAEDHLRILCLHLLKHGAWRPLWLCDLAAAVESRPSNFDWERCLGRNKRRANWILCAIGLAHRLLGADLGDAPVNDMVANLPAWLVRCVMGQWNAPYSPNLPLIAGQIPRYFRKPGEMLRDLRKRWPNAIQSTVDANGPFNHMSRLPFQSGNCYKRVVKLLPQLAGLLRE